MMWLYTFRLPGVVLAEDASPSTNDVNLESALRSAAAADLEIT